MAFAEARPTERFWLARRSLADQVLSKHILQMSQCCFAGGPPLISVLDEHAARLRMNTNAADLEMCLPVMCSPYAAVRAGRTATVAREERR